MEPITIETVVNAPISQVWSFWNEPQHLEKWAFASDDWEAYDAKNDLRVGGKFSTIMAAKDKSASFEFGGTYTALEKNKRIEYIMDDNRRVKIIFEELPEGVKVVQSFDPENESPREFQQSGWQAILDNFKKYAESAVQ